MQLHDFKHTVGSLAQKGRALVRSGAQPDLYTLLRLRRQVAWIDYVGSPGQLLMACCVALLAVLVTLGFVLLLLEGLLKHVAVASLPALVLWLHDPLQFPLPLNARFTPVSLSAFKVALTSAAAISFLYLSFAAGMLREAWRDFRSVFLFSRKNSPTQPPSASQFVRISPALGLAPTVIDAPSLTGVLDLLEDVAGQAPPLSEAIAEEAVAWAARQEEESRVRVRVRITHSLTITLCRANNKQESCSFKNDTWAALIAYLALQPKGAWVSRQSVLQTIYGGQQPEQDSLFKLHIRRIRQCVQRLAAEAGLLPCEQPEGEGCPSFELIEHLPRDPEHVWRLAPTCEVEVFPTLSSLSQQLQQAKQQQVDLLRWADLYRRCELAVQEYGQGLLSDHQPRHRTWRWSKTCFLRYRDLCLSLLDEALACGRKRLCEENLPPDERRELLSHLASLSGWFALVAIGLVPKEELAEEALRQSLAISLQLSDLTAAEDVYQDFAETIARRGGDWDPQPETSALWQQVTARAQAARRAQRSRKKRGRIG